MLAPVPRLAIVCLVFALDLGGCLSPPTGRPADAGDRDAGVEPAFPPPGVTIDAISAIVADVDDDGASDVVLGSAGAADQRGVYILRGGPDGIGATYHTRVVTERIAPRAVTVADVGGTSAPELVVFDGEGEHGVALLFPGAAPGELEATPWVDEIPDAPVPAEALAPFVRVDDLDGDADPDLLFGAPTDKIKSGELSGFDEGAFSEIVETRPTPGEPIFIFSPRDAFTVETEIGRDLVIADLFKVWRHDAAGGDGADAWHGKDHIAEIGQDVQTRVDLDGDPDTIEILGAFHGTPSVTEAWPSTIESYAYDGPEIAWPGDLATNVAVQLVQIDDDAGGRPDLLLLQDHSGIDGAVGPTRLMVVRNVRRVEGPLALTTSSVTVEQYWTADDFHSRFLLVGNFDGSADGDDEVLLLDGDGETRCFIADAIAPCVW